jgi:hypothetical protein
MESFWGRLFVDDEVETYVKCRLGMNSRITQLVIPLVPGMTPMRILLLLRVMSLDLLPP